MDDLRGMSRLLALVLICGLVVVSRVPAQTAETAGADLDQFYRDFELALRSGRPAAYLAMLSPTLASDPGTLQFVPRNIAAGVTNVALEEIGRLRVEDAPPGDGYWIVLGMFKEQHRAGEVSTWLLNVRRDVDPVTNLPFRDGPEWRIVSQERLTSVGGIYRLKLHPERQYIVRNLEISATDFTLTLPEGMAFVADTGSGVTALVLQGEGEMEFAPTPSVEREQLKIFAGTETLETAFDSAFLRMHPNDFDTLIARDALIERTIGPRDFRAAQVVFDKYAPESYNVDLGHLSDDQWWALPNEGDLLAEVQTPHFDNLTYVLSQQEAEDVQLFEREGNRNISMYASEEKLATRGQFYSEDDLVNYDILNYELDAALFPKREWMAGRATLTMRAVSDLTILVIRLADALAVRSVWSDVFGSLFPFQTPGRNTIVLNLPERIVAGSEFTLEVEYEGQLPAEGADHQALARYRTLRAVRRDRFAQPILSFQTPEPHYLYSRRSLWYPQSTVTDFATAQIRLTVPADFDCVASGQLVGPPKTLGDEDAAFPAGSKQYEFEASQPLRYLAAVVSDFEPIDSVEIELADLIAQGRTSGPRAALTGKGVYHDSLTLSVSANPGQRRLARTMSARAEDMIRFYTSVVGDVPYPSLAITLIESELPGGHSPAYVSLVMESVHSSDLLWSDLPWRGDPVYFRDFPDFFLAHELAHQWWGQAVGWNNYHEQWLSEGLAHYFAALYADHVDGRETFRRIVRQMRDWAMEKSDQGPVYLGSRLGHVEQDARIFRALVYNKSAMVLHMLRRLIGDDAFFRGLRRYYDEHRFQKAGTEDLRRAFEQEANLSLTRFFDRWIHESGLPDLRFTYRTQSQTESSDGDEQGGAADVVLRFEQLTEELYDVPVTVTLKYATGETRDVVVNVTDRITETQVPLTGILRDVDVNRDYAALGRITDPIALTSTTVS